jgi:hypothetical protein
MGNQADSKPNISILEVVVDVAGIAAEVTDEEVPIHPQER